MADLNSQSGAGALCAYVIAGCAEAGRVWAYARGDGWGGKLSDVCLCSQFAELLGVRNHWSEETERGNGVSQRGRAN